MTRRPRPAGEGPDALLATARSLWPGATVSAGGRGRAPDAGRAQLFAAVPDLAHARLLVPLGSPAAAGAAVCRLSAASGHREVVTRLAADAATRLTRGRVLRDRVVVHPVPDADALADHLARRLGGPVTFALGVGPARVNRKPVLQVFDERGHVAAFVKLGDSAQARADVGAEAAALRRLHEHRFERLVVPRVLDVSEWNGMLVLAMSALRPRPPVRHRTGPPLPAMRELARVLQRPPSRLAELTWWRHLHATIEGVPDEALRTTLRHGWDAATERHGHRVVGVGAWHGDWTPWNMAHARSRTLVWDWERFEEGVPLGLDATHFEVQAAVRAHGLDPAVVGGVVDRLAGASPYAALLADVYLLTIGARYASLLGAELGDDVAPSARVMAAALAARLDVRKISA
ncbi:hypothetical protein ABFT23_21745 [Nocardioides sp. C4-1]|uniref:hypothetical protein n=1 Tax=Nocardioides sp. C4-1 TaxID=3151851 RepID=UPI00326677A5